MLVSKYFSKLVSPNPTCASRFYSVNKMLISKLACEEVRKLGCEHVIRSISEQVKK